MDHLWLQSLRGAHVPVWVSLGCSRSGLSLPCCGSPTAAFPQRYLLQHRAPPPKPVPLATSSAVSPSMCPPSPAADALSQIESGGHVSGDTKGSANQPGLWHAVDNGENNSTWSKTHKKRELRYTEQRKEIRHRDDRHRLERSIHISGKASFIDFINIIKKEKKKKADGLDPQ